MKPIIPKPPVVRKPRKPSAAQVRADQDRQITYLIERIGAWIGVRSYSIHAKRVGDIFEIYNETPANYVSVLKPSIKRVHTTLFADLSFDEARTVLGLLHDTTNMAYSQGKNEGTVWATKRIKENVERALNPYYDPEESL